MDHRTIEESGLVERYLQGTLPLAEREEFEDHYLDCPACLERLELTRRLRSGLAQVAADEGARATALQQGGVLAALARLARSRSGGLLAAGLLLAALAPAGLLWRQSTGLERVLGEERAARRRLEARQSAPADPSAQQGRTLADQTERQLAAARRALETERARAAAERTAHDTERQRLAGELADARGPQAHTTLLSLGPERSTGGEPAAQLTLPVTPSWVVLALDLPPAEQPEGGTYRAALRRAGRRLWQSPEIEPDGSGAVLLSLPSGFLAPGDYEIDLVPARGGPAAASFRFRVRPPAGR